MGVQAMIRGKTLLDFPSNSWTNGSYCNQKGFTNCFFKPLSSCAEKSTEIMGEARKMFHFNQCFEPFCKHGSFWIMSQTLGYLWKLNERTQDAVNILRKDTFGRFHGQ